MSKSLRLSEAWFRRGLWLVALVFAGFLIGLGGAIVGDLPKVEQPLEMDRFLDQPRAEALRTEIRAAGKAEQDARAAQEQAQLKHQVARSDASAARQSFQQWIATRQATQQGSQDPEVVNRTRALDALVQAERTALGAVERSRQQLLDAQQGGQRARQSLAQLEGEGRKAMQAEARRVELRVFLYRLALTLPLLAVAGWLFKRHRQGTWWPFVWGFVFFALFAFFVELVPYLPSYGGYVRYVVGIVLTVLVGRQAIVALQRYLERQRQAEALPDAHRRQALSYDTALARLAKSVCPGCERPVDLKDEHCDFCPHCGIGLFRRCEACDTRRSTFTKFCRACGTPSPAAPAPAAQAGIAPA